MKCDITNEMFNIVSTNYDIKNLPLTEYLFKQWSLVSFHVQLNIRFEKNIIFLFWLTTFAQNWKLKDKLNNSKSKKKCLQKRSEVLIKSNASLYNKNQISQGVFVFILKRYWSLKCISETGGEYFEKSTFKQLELWRTLTSAHSELKLFPGKTSC